MTRIVCALAAIACLGADGEDRVDQMRERAGQGRTAWARSCPAARDDGLCVRVRKVKSKHRCGGDRRPVVRVRERRARRTAEARAHFEAVLALWADATGAIGSEPAREAVASARFHLAEPTMESLLAMSFPTGLAFDPERPAQQRRDEKRFKAWLDDARARMERLQSAYREVYDNAPAGSVWRAAAMARIGQAYRYFADELIHAEIPRRIRTGPYAEDATDAYCDALAEVAVGLEEQARDAFGRCVEASGDRDAASLWRALCEAEVI